jgi:ABC-type lipoprotein release transport system permease subunit
MLIRMAWRNLWRQKRRTMITAFTIAFGVLLSTTFTGLADYTYNNAINSGATLGFGHITIEPKGYNETPTLDRRLHDADDLRRRATGIPGITGATTKIVGQAMFASAVKNVGGTFMGIDPAQENRGNNLILRSLVSGSLFGTTEGRLAIVGAGMAEKLNLGLGKKLVYTATDFRGEIVSELARVAGIFRTGVSEVDDHVVLLPIDTLRATLHYRPQEATIVSIFIDDQRHAARIRDRIAAAVRETGDDVLTWSETQPDLAAVVTMDKTGHYLIQILVSLLIAAGILNTILMSVLERTREFGVMMAVGMSPARLFRLVLTESFLIGLVGLAVGIALTVPWYLYMSRVGIDFSGLVGGDYSVGGVLVEPVIRIRLYRETVLMILIAVFSLTLTAGLYPAYRAGRIPPVETLKALY